jgi:hypothetical protein
MILERFVIEHAPIDVIDDVKGAQKPVDGPP